MPLVLLAGILAILLFMLPGLTAPWLPEGNRWILLALFLAIPAVGIFYLICTSRAKCPVCGQRQFLPKNTRKNKKAHHFPLLGYIIPTALQALLFKWFRCVHCGTSIRLKE